MKTTTPNIELEPGVETGMVYCETHGFQYHWHHQCAVCRHAARGEAE
jgi:hypothetical protein